MREHQPPAAPVGQVDLTRVQVAGQDQVPPPTRHALEGPREVAEQDPQPGVGRRKAA